MRHACGVTESSGHGVFGVWPDASRLEARDDVAVWDACLFQTFGDSQIGVVTLKPDFPVDDFQTDNRGSECAAASPTFEGVDFVRIEGRIKRLYSIYLKLKRQKISLDKVYDLTAIRIITKEEKDCYFALGVMRKYWKPFHDRIKDFIAMPRENGYRSLHTPVVGE